MIRKKVLQEVCDAAIKMQNVEAGCQGDGRGEGRGKQGTKGPHPCVWAQAAENQGNGAAGGVLCSNQEAKGGLQGRLGCREKKADDQEEGAAAGL